MTVDALLLEWIPDGSLPMYPVGERGQCFYTFRTTHKWDPTRVLRDGRAWISMEVDFLVPDFQAALPGLLRELDELAEDGGTLIFAVRTCCDIGTGRVVLAAMAFVPKCIIPEATGLDGADPADLLSQFCGGIEGRDSTTVHPAIRDAFVRELAWRAEQEERRQKDAEAEARSRELLETYLTEDQVAELQTSGFFHVKLKDGRLFRITKHFGHNVHLIENGLCTVEYCIISTRRVPLYDQMLAQKVFLEALPEEFFRIANFHVHPTPVPGAPAPPFLAELYAELAQT